MHFHSSYECAETSELKFFHGHTTLIFLGKRVIQTNPSKFHERLFRHIFVQITFEIMKKNTLLYILRQGVPEGRSSEGYALSLIHI